MRKKILRAVLIVIVAIFVCEGMIIAISSYVNSRNKEWELELSLEDVTRTGLTITTERGNSELSDELFVDYSYWIERWTLFGWKYAGTKSTVSTAVLEQEGMFKGETLTRDIKWEYRYGKLRPGIYRIGENIKSYRWDKFIAEDGKEYDRREVDADFNLYATFVVFF